MIYVNRVAATDLFSYESLDVCLRDRGLILVEGINGAGKSSIFDSILWVLFGKTTKKLLADDVIREDIHHKPIKGKTRGYVNLSIGDVRVEVFRHRGHKEFGNKLVLVVNDENLTLGTDTETQGRLNGLLGMDYDTFISAVVFPQGGDGFVGLTDAQQKAILDRVSDTDRFAKAREFNKPILEKNKTTLARISTRLFELRQQVDSADGERTRLNEQQNQWMLQTAAELHTCQEVLKGLHQIAPQVDADLEERIADAEEDAAQDRFLAIQDKIREVNGELTDIKTNLAKYEAERKFLVTRVGPRYTTAPPRPNGPHGDPEEIGRQVALLTAQIMQAEAEVRIREKDLASVIKSIGQYTGVCPMCGVKATAEAEAKLIGDSKATQTELEDSLIGLKKIIQNSKNELEKNSKIAKEIDAWVSYRASVEAYKQVDELTDSIDALNKAVTETQQELGKWEQAYTKLLGVRAVYDQLIKEREEQRQKIANHTLEVQQAAARLEAVRAKVSPFTIQLEGLATRSAEASKRISVLTKWEGLISRQVEYGSHWERGFGNAGLKSLVLSHLFPTLTEKANKYLTVLSDGQATIDFSSQTKLGSGDVKEKIEVKVQMDQGGGSYNKASGGERQRVDLASMFALGDLAAERTRLRINLRLLDEPFDNLDQNGSEKVVRALEDLVVPNAGTVLVMSHSDYIKALIPNRIEVQKEYGVSQLLQ